MSLGIAPALTIVGLPQADANGATALVADGQVAHQVNPAKAEPRAPIAPDDIVPLNIVPKPAGGGGVPIEDAAAASTQHPANPDDNDRLTLSPTTPAGPEPGLSTPLHPAKPAGGGGALPPRGGSGNSTQAATVAAVRGQVMPFRVPAPQQATGGAGGGAAGSAALLAAMASATRQGGLPVTAGTFIGHTGSIAPGSAPASGGAPTGAAPVQTAPTMTAEALTAPGSSRSSGGTGALLGPDGSGMAQLSFPYFAVYVRDVEDGVTLFPDVQQVGHVGTTVVLDAQVTGAAVASYNWDTTDLGGALNISGTSTSELTFQWESTAV